MDVNEVVATIEASGLTLSPWKGTGGWLITRPEFQHITTMGESAVTVYSDVSRVYPHEGTWRFERWLSTPGPGPDDIVYEATSLSDAIEVAIRFYCGTPLEIEGWVFPIHRHPEWDPNLIREAYANAHTLTSGEWQDIRLDYYEAYKRAVRELKPEWPDYPELTFRPINHRSRTDLVLWLRRDCRAVYIVRQIGTSGA